MFHPPTGTSKLNPNAPDFMKGHTAGSDFIRAPGQQLRQPTASSSSMTQGVSIGPRPSYGSNPSQGGPMGYGPNLNGGQMVGNFANVLQQTSINQLLVGQQSNGPTPGPITSVANEASPFVEAIGGRSIKDLARELLDANSFSLNHQGPSGLGQFDDQGAHQPKSRPIGSERHRGDRVPGGAMTSMMSHPPPVGMPPSAGGPGDHWKTPAPGWMGNQQ